MVQKRKKPMISWLFQSGIRFAFTVDGRAREMKAGINLADNRVPEEKFTLHGMKPVAKVEIFPPHQHPKGSAIQEVFTLVKVTAVTGESRQYGFDEAFIDSYLRVRCVGYNPRFSEVAA